MRRWRFVRRAGRRLKRWVLVFVRRTAPVLRIPAPVQRAFVIGYVALARVQRVFSRPPRGAHVLPPPRVPRTCDPLVLAFNARASRQVLTDRHQFSVRNYDWKMSDILGRFFLGLDYDDAEYKAQAALWRDIADGRDAGLVYALANRAAKDTPLDHGSVGCVDVVDWTGRTLERFVQSYFGVPTLNPPDPGERRRGSALLDLFQRVSSYIFNLEQLTGHLYEDAKDAGGEVKKHLTDLVAHKLSSRGPEAGDVVDRLLDQGSASQPERDRIVALLGGTLSGLFVPTSSQFVRVVDFLLDLPLHELSTFRAIAFQRAGQVTSPEDHLTNLAARYVLESARFDPFPMALIRHCANGAELFAGSGKAKAIPAGASVVAVMNSVAFDPLLAKQPAAFLTGRPPAHSLVFGAGQHECIGASHSWPIATALMTAMALRLFALPGLRRAPGRRGTLRYRDSWPASFELRYDHEAPGANI